MALLGYLQRLYRDTLLRGTSNQCMIDAGFADAATEKRTGYLRLENLKDNQNIRGKTGKIKKAAILPSSEKNGEEASIDVPVLKKENLNQVKKVLWMGGISNKIQLLFINWLMAP